MRGYAVVALCNPKDPWNVGAALRACDCYDAAMMMIQGNWFDLERIAANTPKAHRHMPTLFTDNLFHSLPDNCSLVAVDILPQAIALPRFVHPERACYVFGPENGTIPDEVVNRCIYRVMVPTRRCMNLAATVNVVLYDRMIATDRRNYATCDQ